MNRKEQRCFTKLDELLEMLAHTGNEHRAAIPADDRAGYLEEGRAVLQELMSYIDQREAEKERMMDAASML